MCHAFNSKNIYTINVKKINPYFCNPFSNGHLNSCGSFLFIPLRDMVIVCNLERSQITIRYHNLEVTLAVNHHDPKKLKTSWKSFVYRSTIRGNIITSFRQYFYLLHKIYARQLENQRPFFFFFFFKKTFLM